MIKFLILCLMLAAGYPAEAQGGNRKLDRSRTRAAYARRLRHVTNSRAKRITRNHKKP